MQANGYVEPAQKVVSAEETSKARIVWLAVQGMECANCAVRVRNSLLALPGMVSAEVDWERGLAFVDYVPEKTNKGAIALAVAAAGKDGHYNYRAQIISFKGWAEWWMTRV